MAKGKKPHSKKEKMNCSFCGKEQGSVKNLIAGADAFICGECVTLCAEILVESRSEKKHTKIDDLPAPRDVKEYLDRHVVGQDQAKKVLSVAIHNHYKRLHVRQMKKKESVEIAKSNVLLIGPTGCGKTLLAQTLARFLQVPFTIADATALTEAGYVGEDVENIIQRLLSNCDYDTEMAKKGIVYIDEIDKLSRKSENPSITRDVSGEGVQQALLKLIEGSVASIPPQGGRKHPQQEFLHVDTSDILFICGGAFDGLEKVIQQRTSRGGIGYAAELKDPNDRRSFTQTLKEVQARDLISYGLIPEFVGRLSVDVVLDELSEEDLVRVLTEPESSLIAQYRYLFSLEGVELEFQAGALQEIAKKAIEMGTGARGLRSILEHMLLDTMFDLPSFSETRKVIVDKEVVAGKRAPLVIYDEDKKVACAPK